MIKVGNITIEIYDGIKDMPADKYHQFNAFVMIEAGVGSDIDGFYTRLSRIKSFARINDVESINAECDNLYSCVAGVMSGVDIGMAAFIPMIKTWNGKKFPLVPDEKAQEFVKKLGAAGATKGWFDKMIGAFKKKTEEEIKLYFPSLRSGKLGKALAAMKSQALAYVQEVTKGVDLSADIQRLEDYLTSLDKPKTFAGADGVEAMLTVRFNNVCLSLAKLMNSDPAKASTISFFAAIVKLREMAND